MKTSFSKLLRLLCTLCIACWVSAPTQARDSFANSLVTYYPFNGRANNESGNRNIGTVCGAVLTADRFGNPNRAYAFDGVSR